MRHRFLLLAVLALVTGCGGLRMERYLYPRPDDWPTFARTTGPYRVRIAGALAAADAGLVSDIAAGTGNGSPVVVDSIVFVGTLRGELCALSVATGKEIGSIGLGDAIQGSPVIDRNVAFVATLQFPAIDDGVRSRQREAALEEKLRRRRGHPVHRRGDRIYFGNTAGVFTASRGRRETSGGSSRFPDNRTYKGIRSSPAADSGTDRFRG